MSVEKGTSPRFDAVSMAGPSSIQGIEGSSPSSPANLPPEHKPNGRTRRRPAPDAASETTFSTVKPRRRSGEGSVFQDKAGRWRGARLFRGYRYWVYGKSADEVQQKLNDLKAGIESKRGKRNQVIADNVRRIIELGIARGRDRGWTDERTAEVIAAWLAPARVRSGVWGPCVYCGEEAAGTVDHKTPLVRGGTNSPRNLASACWACNRRKGWMTVAEFREFQKRHAA